MKTLKSRDSRGSFVVDQTALERLVLALGGHDAVSQIHIEFSDGSSARPDHVADVLELRNGEGKRIHGMAFECARPSVAWQTGGASLRYALVTLRNGRGATIRYHVSGEEREVLELSDSLDEWVGSITPWYDRLAGADGLAFLVISVLSMASVAMIALALRATVPTVPGFLAGVAGPDRARVAEVLSVASAVLPLLGGGGLALLRERLFPPAAFAIGSDGRRHARVETVRRLVGLAVLAAGGLALAAGVVAGLLV